MDESIQNLTSKSGGDNEKLIFRILKRGEKLRLDEAKSEADLTDEGLRYDLTVPLVRYFSKHQNELQMPFKALQMGNVWRADRPQKGRYRQFMQCDIDIIGEPTNLAEIELILATTTTLGRLGFFGFQIRINERRILRAMSDYSGFPGERFDEVCITLDKMDKIGKGGVKAELLENGFAEESVAKYIALFEGMEQAQNKLDFLEKALEGNIPADVIPNLRETIETVETTKQADFEMVFDPTIVRGMSIGFERIILILMDQGFKVPGRPEKIWYLLEKNLPSDRLAEAIESAQKERAAGKDVLVVRMNKNKKHQKQQLTDAGYTSFEEFYANPIQK